MAIPLPTLPGFIAWARTAVGVPVSGLPDAAPDWGLAYDASVMLVNLQLSYVDGPIFMLATYNLAASNLLNWTQDTAPSTFFADARSKLGINNFVPGLPNSVSDNGTSVGLTVQKFLEGLSLSDLQLMKDPYGRAYLGFAQKAGTLWGLS